MVFLFSAKGVNGHEKAIYLLSQIESVSSDGERDESEVKTLALQRAAEVMREVGRPEITDYEVVVVVEKR